MKKYIIANIAITNLHLYNNGELLFKWLELPATEEEVAKALDYIKISHNNINYYDDFGCPMEECFITDYESDFFRIGEYTSVLEINELAESINNLPEFDQIKLKNILDVNWHNEEDILDIINNLDDYTFFQGKTDEIIDNLIEEELAIYKNDKKIPDFLIKYFDWEKYKRDILFDYTTTTDGLLLNY